jgi:hypothetical protein
LANQPFIKPGTKRKFSNTKIPTSSRTPATIILALNTLGTFNFEQWLLIEFLRDHVVTYLKNEVEQVRRAAVSTCCRLVASIQGEKSLTKGYVANVCRRRRGKEKEGQAQREEKEGEELREEKYIEGGRKREKVL